MFGDTPLVMIEDDAALEELCQRLLTQPVIGVDTEADSFHHYKERLCLIQVSDPDQDYIIDPLKIDGLGPLAKVLEAPDVVKVLHGGDYDVVSLKRDYDIQIRNIFDTMIAAQFLAMKGIGLADLIKRFFGHIIDKKYQRHDWTRRPLLPEHLDYARGDTHFLLALREVLTLRLKRARRLAAHSEECALLEEREWKRSEDESERFLRVKGSKTLDDTGLRVLRAVWRFRDEEAARKDRPAFKVVPGPVLLKIAHKRPTTEAQLDAVIRSGSSLRRRYGEGLLKAVAAGLADTEPLPAKKSSKREKSPPRGREDAPAMDRLLAPLKAWRNEVVSTRRLPPVAVASNGLLKEIARVAPQDVKTLATVPGIRRWQVRDYGAELLEVLNSVDAPPPKAKKKRRRRRKSSSSSSAS